MSTCIVRLKPGSKSRYQVELYSGKLVQSHRLAYALANNVDVFTMGGVVLHSCDNPHCVNPEHLTLGTHADNVADKVTKGRQAYGDSHGNVKLSEEQVAYGKANYVKRCRLNGGRAMAKLFNVHESTISDIMCGYTRRLA